MAEHTASMVVNAPATQVYQLFTHFNDYPKFMTYVREVTYSDQDHSHWVVDVVGRHEWEAVNENWVPNSQIGWRSTDGFENYGVVRFEPIGNDASRVTVEISYNPPAGILGDLADVLGAGKRFEAALQHDLDQFAAMVAQSPPGALDPTSSNYLFHAGSAAAKGETTARQDATMTGDNRAGNWAETAGITGASGGSSIDGQLPSPTPPVPPRLATDAESMPRAQTPQPTAAEL